MTPIAGSVGGDGPSSSFAAPTAETSGNLCLGCGLCCDSGFFTHVKLDAEDRARLNAIGVPAPEQINQPCQFFDRCCTVYSHRPAKCGAYRCEVLKDLDKGVLSFKVASDKVAQALAYRASLLAQLPPGMTANEMIEQWRDEGDRPAAFPMAQARLAFVVFRSFVERHFLRPKQRRISAQAINPP